MATLRSRKVQESLDDIKCHVKDSYDWMRDNYDRFHAYNNFVCRTSLTQADMALFDENSMPAMEFNILEAYISRLRGEFSKQEPSLTIMPAYDAANVDPKLLNVLDAHVRAILFDSNTDNMEFDIYTDTLIGGFSAMKVWTDYASDMSFDQNIFIGKVYDATLCYWDKMARKSHKGDGAYAGEFYPYTQERFEDEFGTQYTKDMKFAREIEGFSWSYTNGNEKIVLVGDHYKKLIKTGKIVQLTNGQVMTVDDYEQFLANWNSRTDIMMQAPGVIGQSRTTEFTTICRYRIIENAVLEYTETDFKYLPIIFVDGNSRMIRENNHDAAKQLTRPYVYHAKGVQRLKNFSGVMLANSLENIIQSQIMIAEESIPEAYLPNWLNLQKSSLLPYRAFQDTNGQISLPPPSAVPRPPMPPEIAQTFTMSDEVTQAILGSYDASLGINNNQLSGTAIANGATQSNAAAMPYIVNYMKALNQVGRIILDLIPKYYLTPRSVRVKSMDGKSGYAGVNYPGMPQMNYIPEMLDIRIEAGVSFELQQQQALMALTNLMKVNQTFAQFMMGETGLETLLNNLNIRGIETIKQEVSQFVQMTKQQQQQMQQMQMQQAQAPLMIKQAELQQNAQKNQQDFLIKSRQMAVDEQDADTRRINVLAEIGEKADKVEIEQTKVDAEEARTAVASINAMTNAADTAHKHAMDILGLHHSNEQFNADLGHRLKELQMKRASNGTRDNIY